MPTITITNIGPSRLSLDIPVPAGGVGVGHPRAIRASLDRGSSIDVGDIITIDDLNRTIEFQQLLATGLISVAAVGETADIKIPGSELAPHGSAHALGSTDPVTTLPTVNQKAALAGTGTPGAGDVYVSNSDARMTNTRTPTDASVTGAKLAVVDAAGLGAMAVIRKAFPAGGGGAPDDVAIYTADAPFGFRVVDVFVLISTVIALSTVTLRDTVGGGGAALSDSFDSAVAGLKRNALLTATGTIALGGSLVLYRSDSGVAGEVIILIQKT
jgi:hypothetical protein